MFILYHNLEHQHFDSATMVLIYDKEVGLMVDYMIFDVVRSAINEAVAHGKEIGFGTGAITVEVKNLPKANSVHATHKFVFCEAITTGDFNNTEKLEFLLNHVHDAHIRHLKGQAIPPVGWETDSIMLGYKTLFFASEPSDYSIAVGVMGAGGKINATIVQEILQSLPNTAQ